MEIHSPAFRHTEAIPARYTCDGENISLPLSWSHVPKSARSLALICDDPDASNGDWVHWIVYNNSPQLAALPEHLPTTATAGVSEYKLTQGLNSWPRLGYGGPCPPSGVHRYFFRLYALDLPLGLPANLTKAKLLERIQGHVLAETELMGTYQRQR